MCSPPRWPVGRFGEGWPVYVRWISLVWSGQVEEVIGELETAAEELGLPAERRAGRPARGGSSPRR